MQPAKKFAGLNLWLLSAVAVLMLFIEAVEWAPGGITPFGRLEYAARDMLMRLRGAQQPSPDIVIVAIDDFSLNWTGFRWPWPRSYFAEIVEQIQKGGAKVIGVDLFLFAPDENPENDRAFAEALGSVPGAVTVAQIFRAPNTDFSLSTLSQPLPQYMERLDAIGITAFTRDEDAIVRRLQAYDTHNGKVFYHWAFEAARLYWDAETPSDPAPTSLRFNGQTVPLSGGQILVNYAGPAGTYATYRAADVHDGITLEENHEAFRGKIVLLGATTVTLQDVYPTPYDAQIPMPGVEVVANAIDTILQGKYLTEAPPWLTFALILAASAAAGSIVKLKNPTSILVATSAGAAAYLAVCFFALASRNYILPVVMPLFTLLLGAVIPTLEQAVSQELEKRRVRNLFSRFVAPEMVDQIVSASDVNALNKRANLTILFSDIRGFTTLSEKLTPEGVVNLLNPYLEAMTAVIHKHGGTVDKYEGDAIVAFFGEPVPFEDHALRAVRAAVDMLKALDELSAKWLKEGRVEKRFNIGLGLNTGEVFVGLLGSKERINYTIIGDNANLAARLQDLTKTYSWPILVSESTYQQVKEEFDAEFADAVTVKGKTKAVNVYKILGKKGAGEEERVQPWQM